MMNKITIKILVVIIVFSVLSCAGQKSNRSPAGYNLSAPAKYTMPQSLFEISGLSFNKGNPNQVYAIQDEDGELFHFSLGDKEIKLTRFAERGDYEDVAICRNQVVVLRSDGTLFTFPLSEAVRGEITSAKKIGDLLPKGEYEGLYADESTAQVYVLTKESKLDLTKKQTGIFIFKLSNTGTLEFSGAVNLSHKEIDEFTDRKKIKFHPSALAKDPVSKQWFVLSSVNKLLVVTDEQFKVTGAYPLDPGLFNQPEGIAFDQQQNLYISNEGGNLNSGNILLFKYNNP